MFTLKLYNNWLETAEREMPKRQLNELRKLVTTLKVVKSTDTYTLYEGGQDEIRSKTNS